MRGPNVLTRRLRQIAEAYAADASYREIAAALVIAPTTVRKHYATTYRKLGVISKIAPANPGARPPRQLSPVAAHIPRKRDRS